MIKTLSCGSESLCLVVGAFALYRHRRRIRNIEECDLDDTELHHKLKIGGVGKRKSKAGIGLEWDDGDTSTDANSDVALELGKSLSCDIANRSDGIFRRDKMQSPETTEAVKSIAINIDNDSNGTPIQIDEPMQGNVEGSNGNGVEDDNISEAESFVPSMFSLKQDSNGAQEC